MQYRRPADDFDFNGIDKIVHARHKSIRLQQHGRRTGRRRAQPLVMQSGPSGANVCKTGARFLSPRHVQRAPWVACLQQIKTGVELIDALLQLGQWLIGQSQSQAQGVHTQAPGLVDGSSAAFKLPRNPQRQANRSNRHQQKTQPHQQQLGGERVGFAHSATV